MIDREAIMRKIDSLPDADLKKISKFLSSLEERPDTGKHKADVLSSVIGICEGPQDLAEKHDSYAY
jgi:mRNA-degrading endonuclease RelE of RelBE toxin-antitoxin system